MIIITADKERIDTRDISRDYEDVSPLYYKGSWLDKETYEAQIYCWASDERKTIAAYIGDEWKKPKAKAFKELRRIERAWKAQKEEYRVQP